MIQNDCKNFWILVSFSSYPLFCMIGWWHHFVCKKQRNYTRFISRDKSTQRRFLQLKCFSKHCINSWENFYYFFSSGQMFPLTVTFQRSDTAIFPYAILVICKQNDVISWYLILIVNMKTKWHIKEI